MPVKTHAFFVVRISFCNHAICTIYEVGKFLKICPITVDS
jgi:hypothetical protein